MLSYPHFGPKNTHSNFSAIFWYFQIHRVFYCASNAHFTVTISNRHTSKAIQGVFLHYESSKRVSRTIACFPAFYSNFLHKIIQKGILVISYKGTHFSPYNLSLNPFNLSAWTINQILYKNHLSFASESVWVSLGRF